MSPFKKHLINSNSTVHESLTLLNELAADAILFIVDDNQKLIGSLTDGDLRRGFIKGLTFSNQILDFLQPNPKRLNKSNYSIEEVIEYRKKGFQILPVVDEDNIVVNVINFKHFKSYLPLDVVIMAGGRGERLRPLTDNIPKPLLLVGDKPIIEHNIDRLRSFGIDDMWIAVKYLGEQIKNHLKDGENKSIRIKYIEETSPLGTAGALSLVEGYYHDSILMMNSDLLTNINFEDFYLFFKQEEADIAVACIPYQVNVPYGVMETEGNIITKLREKPTYTHFSNAGIYLIKNEVLAAIPKGEFYNATDLIEKVIETGGKAVAYPLVGYWLDIGRHDDYLKAQNDIKHLDI